MALFLAELSPAFFISSCQGSCVMVLRRSVADLGVQGHSVGISGSKNGTDGDRGSHIA